MSECQTKAGNQNTLSHYLTRSLTHSLTHSLSHWLTLDMLNNFCFHVYAQKSLSHFHTLSLSHTLALSHSLILSFTLSRHAEQLLFSCLGSKVTLSLSHSLTLSHSHTLSFSHSLSLSTCWTTFVFISMLKTHCLLLKIAMLLFDLLITLSC